MLPVVAGAVVTLSVWVGFCLLGAYAHVPFTAKTAGGAWLLAMFSGLGAMTMVGSFI